MQVSTQTDNHKSRKNITTEKKADSLKNWFEVLKP